MSSALSVVRILLVLLIRGYRWGISPLKTALFGPFATCRHVPSCSAYAEQALAEHGPVRGLLLTAHRLARCHPWGTSGWDPVPSASSPLPKARPGGAAVR